MSCATTRQSKRQIFLTELVVGAEEVLEMRYDWSKMAGLRGSGNTWKGKRTNDSGSTSFTVTIPSRFAPENDGHFTAVSVHLSTADHPFTGVPLSFSSFLFFLFFFFFIFIFLFLFCFVNF